MPEALPTWNVPVDALARFARAKALVIDLDGTLLRAPHTELSQSIAMLRRKLATPNCRLPLIVATGRTETGIERFLKPLGYQQGMPLILYNGGLVYKFGTRQLLRRETISNKALADICEVGANLGARVLAYYYRGDDANCFTLNRGREYVLAFSRQSCNGLDFNGMEIRWAGAEPAEECTLPTAILIDGFASPADAARIAESLALTEGITVTASGGRYIEVRASCVDKGSGMAIVAEHLDILPQNVIALGDHDNDAELLAWAGTGIAVSSASARALAASDYVCKYGAVEGAIQLLRLIGHAKRYLSTLGLLNERENVGHGH